MNIALVCGHFLPKLGYIEVHLARAFAEAGHRVLVVTSTAVPPYVRHLTSRPHDAVEGVEIRRLKPAFSLGQIVVARGIRRALASWRPDAVVAVGLGKRFPLPVYASGLPVLSLFGDNAHTYGKAGFVNNLKNSVLFALFKRGVYRAAIAKSAVCVAYTPESFALAGRAVGGRAGRALQAMDHYIHLGFWPDEFYFDAPLREQKRAELGFDEGDVVLVTATRVSAEKNLVAMGAVLRSLPEHFKWLIVGAAGDAVSRELNRALGRELGHGRYRMLPHCPRAELNAYYCAADIGLYTVPAISIVEAAGTGLPLALPDAGSLRALADLGFRAAVVGGDPTDTARALAAVSVDKDRRWILADHARRELSWAVQADRLTRWMKPFV